MTLLGGLSVEAFLRDYWQQRPLLIRGALPGFTGPLEPEELAGLALEEDVESRIIRELDTPPGWSLNHGPFSEADFLAQPESHWTLLVQGVNRHHPEVAALLEPFRFLPDWRLDDIMVSYAAPGGSVGPHTDQYDVFLLQGSGRRHWSIGHEPLDDDSAALLPDLPLRILAEFDPDEDWVLEPGDMLYLPPGIPHHGVATEPCLTYSIGFRAPTEEALLGGFIDDLLERIDPEARLSDPGRAPQDNPGELDRPTREQVRAILRRAVADDAAIDRWFGRFITGPDHGEDLRPAEPFDAAAIAARLEAGESLWRSEYARFALLDEGGEVPGLYVDGREYLATPDTAALVRNLCAKRAFSAADLRPTLATPAGAELLTTLVNEGALFFPESG